MMQAAIGYLIAAECELRAASERAQDGCDLVQQLRLSEWASRVAGFRRYLEGSEAEMATRWLRIPMPEDEPAYREG